MNDRRFPVRDVVRLMRWSLSIGAVICTTSVLVNWLTGESFVPVFRTVLLGTLAAIGVLARLLK